MTSINRVLIFCFHTLLWLLLLLSRHELILEIVRIATVTHTLVHHHITIKYHLIMRLRSMHLRRVHLLVGLMVEHISMRSLASLIILRRKIMRSLGNTHRIRKLLFKRWGTIYRLLLSLVKLLLLFCHLIHLLIKLVFHIHKARLWAASRRGSIKLILLIW